MTTEERNQRVQEKAKQINDLCNILHIREVARQWVNPEGFIESVVYYIDQEVYPEEPKKEEPIKKEKKNV